VTLRVLVTSCQTRRGLLAICHTTKQGGDITPVATQRLHHSSLPICQHLESVVHAVVYRSKPTNQRIPWSGSPWLRFPHTYTLPPRTQPSHSELPHKHKPMRRLCMFAVRMDRSMTPASRRPSNAWRVEPLAQKGGPSGAGAGCETYIHAGDVDN
jgi:hypothetical protein